MTVQRSEVVGASQERPLASAPATADDGGAGDAIVLVVDHLPPHPPPPAGQLLLDEGLSGGPGPGVAQGAAPATTLAAALLPTSLESFLSDTLARSWGLFPGPPERFAGLCPWETVNGILRDHRFDVHRLRLAHQGKRLPPKAFLEEVPQLERLAEALRVNAAAMQEYLRQGATLIVDAIDEAAPAVRTMASSFELVFGVPVPVNAYIVYGASQGFGLHWDDHDTFIMQVAGTKEWRAHRPTGPFPLHEDQMRLPQPTDEPVWEGVLRPGELLYLPRGWWHAARGLGEPTLHLTFSVRHPTGVNLLPLVRTRLASHEVARRDLPRSASDEERRTFAAELRSAMLDVIDDDLVSTYLADADARATARPSFALPLGAQPGRPPLPPDLVVRLSTPRSLKVHEGPGRGQVEFRVCGRRWLLKASAVPVLGVLAKRMPVTLAELCQAAPEGTGADAVAGLVHALLVAGLVEAVPAEVM